MSLDVTSWAFSLEDIPVEYTGNGRDVSPPLQWSRGPESTVCYALILDDPDGPRGVWVHWVVWNIPENRLHAEVPRKTDTVPGDEHPCSKGDNGSVHRDDPFASGQPHVSPAVPRCVPWRAGAATRRSGQLRDDAEPAVRARSAV